MPGTVVVETVESRALSANTLGDSPVRRVAVWLPPSYARARDRSYPVIYWLAGFAGTGESLFQGNPWAPGLGERLDRLVEIGAMGEVIVVAPDGFTAWGGSQYLDSPVGGGHETHLCAELVPHVERRYRARATREARAIGGKSSGGFGALVLAMRHPELFGAVASHAGDCHFDLSILPDVPVTVRTLRRHGGVEGFLAHFARAVVKRSDDFTTIMMLALAAAYSPDATKPAGVALPFDQATGELDAGVWRRWKAWDPVELVGAHADALRRMALVYLDAGTRDEHALDLGARLLSARLTALGVAHRHEEFDDGHRGTAYRYDVSLPLLAAAVGAERAP
ncbi:MAG TPA: alpha/beta hydrolase-fold protein [Polyangia bacterium]|nr:alpha/beta hydrolase-fold protein [Polyangia bacterium]